MAAFTPLDISFEQRVRDSFARQTAMASIGATMDSVKPGEVVISAPFHPGFVQQHGYMHAAISTMIADSACGYAALSLTPPGAEVLTAEYKLNFLNPAKGERFVATGRVLKSGKSLTVCNGEVVAFEGEKTTLIATILTTMFVLQPR